MLGSFQYSHYRTKVRNLEEQCLQRCNAEAKKVRPSSRCSHSAFSGLDGMFTSANRGWDVRGCPLAEAVEKNQSIKKFCRKSITKFTKHSKSGDLAVWGDLDLVFAF